MKVMAFGDAAAVSGGDAFAVVAAAAKGVRLTGVSMRLDPIAIAWSGDPAAVLTAGIFVWSDQAGSGPGAVTAVWTALADAGWATAIPVREHVMSGTPSAPRFPAVTRIGLLTRKSGVTREEFQEHWLHHHAPLVLGAGPLFDRYVINLPEAGEPWDGILEQRFDSDEALREHDRQVAQDKPEVLADVTSFIGAAVQLRARDECWHHA